MFIKPKKMKKTPILFALCLLTIQAAQAQEPRPDWVRQPPFPPQGANYIFVYGMGMGDTEEKAELSAWKNAFGKALNEGGLVGIKAQAKTLDDVLTMNDLETQIPISVMQRRLVCQTLPIFVTGGKVKVYVLLQVQRDGRRNADFYSHDLSFIKCEAPEFIIEIKEYNKSEVDKRRIERENATKVKGQDALFANGENVLKNGHELGENAVRTLFANSKSYKLYDSGIGLYSAADVLYWCTGIVGLAGVVAASVGGGGGDATVTNVGLYMLGGAATFAIAGISCTISGRHKISKAVELYNNGKMYSSAPRELKFGLTQNGVGVILHF
jgi:hypothetical protein